MRKVQIPCIYDTQTGEWLHVAAITYDDNNEVVQVDHWDGEGVITYRKGQFTVDENELAPLYHENLGELYE